MKSHSLTININPFKQINMNQMFDKVQMILMMKMSISNNRISRLNYTKIQKQSFTNVLQNRCSTKFHKFCWKTPWNLFLIKLKAISPETLLKKTSTRAFFCEIFETFNNIFFYSTPRVVAF